jgi:putative NIF3 family GTP cyclohydrolase 1 type 2
MNERIRKLLGSNPGSFDDVILKVKKLFKLDKIRNVRSNRNLPYKNNGDILIGVGAAFRNVNHKNCLLITGKMSHHDLLKCKFNETDVIMLEHSNSDRVVLPEIQRLLKDSLKEFEIEISSADVDPVEIC